MNCVESSNIIPRQPSSKAKTDKLIENYLRKIGYNGDMQLEEFNIDAEALRNKMNSVTQRIVGNRPKVSQVFMKLNPYKMAYAGTALVNLFVVFILVLILEHFLTSHYAILGIVSVSVSIGFFAAALVQSIVNLSLPDVLFFINYAKPSIKNGQYFLNRQQIIKNIRGDRIFLIPTSFLLLIVFAVGITLKYRWTEYLSSWFDSLGYMFAVVYFIMLPFSNRVTGDVTLLNTRRSAQLAGGIILLVLLFIKLATNSMILTDFFMAFETPLYLGMFGYSIYDIRRLRLAS